MIKNKTILILGGTGALGKTLTKRYFQENGILIIDFMNSKKVIKNLVKSEKKEINGVIFNADPFVWAK